MPIASFIAAQTIPAIHPEYHVLDMVLATAPITAAIITLYAYRFILAVIADYLLCFLDALDADDLRRLDG
jgi:hypothetical protein